METQTIKKTGELENFTTRLTQESRRTKERRNTQREGTDAAEILLKGAGEPAHLIGATLDRWVSSHEASTLGHGAIAVGARKRLHSQ